MKIMDYTAIDLTEVEQYSGFILADMAGVKRPDRRDSWGAVTLTELRDEVLDAWREGRFERDSDSLDSDVIWEVVGETLRSDSAPIWDAWHELELWGQGWPDVSESEPGVYRFTGTLEDMARTMLQDMLTVLASSIITEVREVLAAWVCPGCGGCGNPRMCWPGEECSGSEEEQVAWRELQATQATSDPIITLIDEHEARVRLSDTQAFLAKMEQVNAKEFARRRGERLITWLGLGAVVLSAALTLATWVLVIR